MLNVFKAFSCLIGHPREFCCSDVKVIKGGLFEEKKFCHIKHHFDVCGFSLSFEKTCVKFCREKLLKHNRIVPAFKPYLSLFEVIQKN